MVELQQAKKIQTCVLRVNVDCKGCKHKFKKKLQRVEGVERVIVDAVEGKVTVFGDVDPLSLIEHIQKAGKHAELWGPKTDSVSIKNGKYETQERDDDIGREGHTDFVLGKSVNPDVVSAPHAQVNESLAKLGGIISMLIKRVIWKNGSKREHTVTSSSGKEEDEERSNNHGCKSEDGQRKRVGKIPLQAPKLRRLNEVNKANAMEKTVNHPHGESTQRVKPPIQQNLMNQQEQGMVSSGHPVGTDQYTHIFSDENTSSCIIM